MNFANPIALAWAALAVQIVIFYILKVRLRRVPVSTLLFWSQIFEEKQPRSIWQQLRHLLSLLLQLLFLFFLVMSLADPFWSWEKLQSRRIVLVVDNSASMNAIDVLPSRLAAAREEGRRLIRGLRARDQMAIVSAGSTPKVACGLTGHQRTLQNALDALAPSDGPTRVSAAVDMARRLLAGHENGHIAILTDGCFPESALLAKAADIEMQVVGQKGANWGITQFQVRRSLVDAIGYQVLVEVQNFSEQPVECRLEIDLNETPVDVVPLKLEAGERWSHTLDHASADGGRLQARLNRADDLKADNQAVALLPRREKLPVLLVTSGSVFLVSVFQAISTVDLQVVSTPPPEIPPGVLAVYHRQVPAQLPPGNVLVIDPATSCDAFTLGTPLENPLVGKQQSSSPLLTHVRLDNVWMPAARRLEFIGPHEVLIAAVTGESLYAAAERKSEAGRVQKLLVLSVDLDKGDLPLRTAFPILMTNAMSWIQGNKGELREAITAGQLAEVDLHDLIAPRDASRISSGDAPLVLRSPDGALRPLPTGREKMTLGPFDQCGVWSIVATNPTDAGSHNEQQPPLLELACNLSNAAESDLRSPIESPAIRHADLLGFAGRPIWFYLTMLAAALISVEWYLYQRRWIS